MINNFISDFELKTARLKKELGVSTDKEIAEFFQLSPKTFSDRRIRNSFPDRKLKEIVAASPEKWSFIDVYWVLTGKTEIEVFAEEGNPLDLAVFNEKSQLAFSRLSELSSNQQTMIFSLIDTLYTQKKRIEFYSQDKYQNEEI